MLRDMFLSVAWTRLETTCRIFLVITTSVAITFTVIRPKNHFIWYWCLVPASWPRGLRYNIVPVRSSVGRNYSPVDELRHFIFNKILMDWLLEVLLGERECCWNVPWLWRSLVPFLLDVKCPFKENNMVIFIFHFHIIPLANLWFIRLQGYFPVLWNKKFPWYLPAHPHYEKAVLFFFKYKNCTLLVGIQ